MTKEPDRASPDELDADADAVPLDGGVNVNETVNCDPAEAGATQRKDPAFRKRVRAIIEEDSELLERLAK